MSTVRPQDVVTLKLSDQDFRDLVAESFDNNLIYTGGYGLDITIRVDTILKTVESGQVRWEVQFGIDVEEKEKS